jgi:hypothetical protein
VTSQVQGAAAGSATGIVPELATEETVISPILITLYIL